MRSARLGIGALVVLLAGIVSVAACSDDESPSGGAGKAGGGSGGSAGKGGASGAGGGAGVGGGGSSGASGADAASGGSGGTAGADAQAPIDGAAGADSSDPTVRGVVVSDNFEPLPNITVLVDGTTVVTDANGAFQVPSAAATYNLIAADSNGREITVYRGLTRRDPLIKRRSLEFKSAAVSGTLSGAAGFPNSATQRANVAFGADQALQTAGEDSLAGTEGPAYGPFNAVWGGGAMKQGSVCAIQYSLGAGLLPTQYHGWGCSNVTLTASGTATVNVALNTALQTTPISGTVQLPAGYTVASDSMMVYRNDTPLRILLVTNNITGTTFSLQAPTGPAELRIGIEVRATATAGGAGSITRLVGPPATGLTIPIDEGPRLASPLANAMDVGLTTNFAWNAAGPGVYRIRFETLTPVNRGYWIYTRETSITLPDLAALGVPLPPGQPFFWSVTAGPAATIDQAASALGRAQVRESRSGESGQRTFTSVR